MKLTEEQIDIVLGEDLAWECRGLPLHVKGMILLHVLEHVPEDERELYILDELARTPYVDVEV